jgi:hypothetical protein
MTKQSYSSRSGWRARTLMAAVGAGALVAAIVPAATAASAATKAPKASHVVKAPGGTVTLHRLGSVNLIALAKKDAASRKAHLGKKIVIAPKGKETPLRLPPGLLKLGGPKARAKAISKGVSSAHVSAKFEGNVTGAHGFDGITAAINGGANSPISGGVGDVSPPDQGLAVGPSTAGTALVEFVNDSLVIYSPSGKTLLGAIPANQIFGLPASAFLSDPRAFWDPKSGHWFLTMFTVGDGATVPSTQYIAVSQTKSPFGPYTTFFLDTTDATNTNCPCFGDFDQVGADNSGFYIATNEFPIIGAGFNGSVIYAMSKSILITAAQFITPPPIVQRYQVSTADPFGSYHLSPSTVTAGSGAPNTEYFVESNSNINPGSGVASGLEVFALLRTARLNTGGRPTLNAVAVNSESYTFPPNAVQKSGATPLGCSVGFCGTATLQTDFNAVQEVTYASGKLYAELSTGFNFGTGQNAGASWFVLKPQPHFGWLSASLVSNGYVKTSQNILYPVIGVNKNGSGYLAFAISGPKKYPSAAYVAFAGGKGPVGPVRIQAKGVNPLDDFTCYPPFSGGQCRYGDYSMAQYFNGQIYMATEYVAPQPRDVFSNWATRVWYAPVP